MLNTTLKFKVAFDKMEAEDKHYNDHFLKVEKGKRGKDFLSIVTGNQ